MSAADVPGGVYYHLPGLFECYDFYRAFLPVYRGHPDWFYPWGSIGSLYGAPTGCLWGGGRVGDGRADPHEVLALLREYGLSGRLTFSNSLLRPEHLSDRRCHALCALFEEDGARTGIPHGVIVHSDLLLHHLRERYPGLYFVSSTTKVLTDFQKLRDEVSREEFRFVVPDFRLNRHFDDWDALPPRLREKIEFLCNECCDFTCSERAACYENVSRRSLGEACPEHICPSLHGGEGYRFSRAMENPGFIGIDGIRETYLPRGFSHFKIEGRGLGSAVLLEFLLYYMTKPEYHLRVREELYLDGMLDLF